MKPLIKTTRHWNNELRYCFYRGDDNNEAWHTMQKQFPGNYTVETYFDDSNITFRYRLKFHTPEDETIFRLRYDND